MDTEKLILRGTKLKTIENNIKKKTKIKNLEQRLDSQKYNIKKKKNHKNYQKIYI